MEELFVRFAHVVGLLVEAAAVLVVAYGSLDAFLRLVRAGGTHVEGVDAIVRARQ